VPPKLRSPSFQLPPHVVRAMYNSNNYNWAGAYYNYNNPTSQLPAFNWIEADWSVPAVSAYPDAPPYSAVAEWIGLDNKPTDLYQAGTNSECYYGSGWIITNYFVWVEVLPFPPSSRCTTCYGKKFFYIFPLPRIGF
jgi:hypothetical protein